MKTVGDLIKELQKHDRRMLLARRTQGHFQCIVPIEWFCLSEEKVNFTTISKEEFKVVIDKRIRKRKVLFVSF